MEVSSKLNTPATLLLVKESPVLIQSMFEGFGEEKTYTIRTRHRLLLC
jgi:hypothetical protein